MSSVTTENGGMKIQFFKPNGKRTSLRLGRMTKAKARSVASRIDDLVASQTTEQPPSRQTLAWLETITDDLYDKLARHGLVKPKERSTLGEFIDSYTANQIVKESTQKTYARARNHLIQFFGEDRDLRKITEGDADDWWAWMLKHRSPTLAENTARKTVSIARQFIKSAKRKRIIESDPFEHLPSTVRPNRKRDCYVDPATIEHVISACPDMDWRLLIALARYGGLRIPSEIRPLRWSDIDWKANRFSVQASKTEHHHHGGYRSVPIFSALRPHLQAGYAQASHPTDHVITRYRHPGSNVGTHFKRIIKRAGVDPWHKPWQNLRSSCETDLIAAGHGLHVVTAWLGHTPKIAVENYLQVTEADYAKAVQNPVQQTHADQRTGPHPVTPESPESFLNEADCATLRGHTQGCNPLHFPTNGRYRTTTTVENREETAQTHETGAKSGATANDDTQFERLRAAWVRLDLKQRKRITKLAEQIAGTAEKAHRSTLPPVTVGATDLLSTQQTADRLGIKPATLRGWIKRKWIKPPERIGGAMFYEREAVELAASQHPRGPKARKDST